MSETLKNILIIKPSSLGDIVLVLPALTALRRSFPEAEISWLVRPEFAPLLENHPHLTKTIPFDRKFLGKAWFNPYALGALLSLIRLLHRSRYDAVFDFQGLFRTGSLAWLSGCKKRLGMSNAREFGRIFYTHKVRQNQDCIHLVDYYLKIVKAAGVSDTGVEFLLPQNSPAASSIRKLLEKQGGEPANYAVFVPGSARKDKRWPIEQFAFLAAKISSEFNLSIIATGTTSEAELIEKFKSHAGVPVVNLAGKTSLSELVELLKSAKLVVCNDTGPGHIAAALGVPLVMIFGSVNPARLAPYKRPDCVVAIEPWNRPFKIRSSDPKYDIKNISVDDVHTKVCEQIKLGSAER
jgi:lipopolysaccharide heptosyltransferase I